MDKKIPGKNDIGDRPDFGKIFREMAKRKNLPESEQKRIAEQKEWNSLDVIETNEKLFARRNKENLKFNQQHRAYDESSIKKLLEYQKRNKLNNAEMTKMFKLSRTTLLMWQRYFSE